MVKVRQLPGIAFRAESLTNPIALPRMDIAAFVGFAQRGPCDTPVAIEDYPQFEEIFGGSYFLAWDAESDGPRTACLASAVRIFFRQGGRRCWVVRVAGPEATANRYPLLGALALPFSGQAADPTRLTPLIAQAGSVGAWADDLQVSLELLGETLARSRDEAATEADTEADAFTPTQPITLTLAPIRSQPLQVGDLLQLDFSAPINADTPNPPLSHRLYFAPTAQEMRAAAHHTHLTIDPARGQWFRQLASNEGPFAADFAASVTSLHLPQALAASWKATPQLLQLELPSAAFPPVGSWLRLAMDADPESAHFWLLVGETKRVNAPNDPTAITWGVQLLQLWQQGHGQEAPLTLRRIQRLRLALHVRDRNGIQQTISDLACVPGHPRYLGNLVSDERFFAPLRGDAIAAPPRPALWAELLKPRFPIALPAPTEGDTPTEAAPSPLILPLAVGPLRMWSERLPDPTPALVRDGLIPAGALYSLTPQRWADFIADLYLDEGLRQSGERALMAEATDRSYLSGSYLSGSSLSGQPLHGLHALLPIEEISLLALPDAAQRGWELLDIARNDNTEPLPSPPTGPCLRPGPFESVAEEAAPTLVTESIATFLPQAAQPQQWRLLPARSYDNSGLLAIQRSAALLASARGDLIAILTMPKEYQSDDALDHQQRLAAALQSVGEKTASYVALYHPWVVYRQEGAGLLAVEPSGVACGVIADRSQRRGAWVPPANELATAVVALSPPAQPGDDRLYFNAGINTIVRHPQGFTLWGAHTQSASAELEEINVRRLLILLRRIALREGQRHAFATNGPIFRRQLKQQFEQLLAHLYALGAFAGASTEEAYQVVVDEMGAPASIASYYEKSRRQGHLQIELRVAPAQPLTFILVRLIQSDGGLLAVHEGLPNGR